LEELIAIAVQFTVEVVGSAFISWPFGFNIRRPTQPESSSVLLYVLLAIAGGMLGWVSAYLLPFRLLPYSWLRVLNIVVAPVVGGFTALVIAAYRSRSNVLIEPRVHFWNAFWFALAFALLRIAYLSRYAT
jgi:hypothetical protein